MFHPVHDHSHHAAIRTRISKPENLQRLAMAALKQVPNSKQIIDKAFNTDTITPQLQPEPQPDLVMHTGFFDV